MAETPTSARASGHLSPDELTTLALDGGEPGARSRTHLAGCGECTTELAALRRVTDAGRDLAATADGSSEQPGEHLWKRILADVRGPGQVAEPRGDGDGGDDGDDDGDGPREAVVHELPRRRDRWRMGAAVAAGVVAILVIGGITAVRDPAVTVADAMLAPLTDGPAAVEARLVDRDGGRELDLTLPDEDPGPGAYYEVWLLDDAGIGMVSLGPTDATGEVRMPVPEGVDLDAYPVVDVSREPVDGDPTHSGDSRWRGRLATG